MDISAEARRLDRDLKKQRNPERAKFEQNYLKTDRPLYGVDAKTMRGLAKRFYRAHLELERDDILALVRELWNRRNHNVCVLSVYLLDHYQDRLLVKDLPFIETLLRDGGTWALVDGLAAWIAGPLTHGTKTGEKCIARWSQDSDFWIRRSALLAHLVPLREGIGDFGAFARIAIPMLAETEFFVRKAIGWVLREASKKDPERVQAFLAEHLQAMSGLTLREGMKRLPEAVQRRLKQRHAKRSAF